MLKKILFMQVFLLTFHPSHVGNKACMNMILFWNVGQGQWITALTPDECLHFDFGGEISYFRKNQNLLTKLCKNKRNILYLSHADLDHYAYYNQLVRLMPEICWGDLDHATLPSKKIFRKISYCAVDLHDVKKVYKPKNTLNKNESSQIYTFKSALIPGDSSQKMERQWSLHIPSPQQIKILSLGHHGSRSSTGKHLLKKLTGLKMAIASARKDKYKHPHTETVGRLREYRIPTLTTEDWGNIGIIF